MRAKLQEIKQELNARMHDPIEQTGKWLRSVIQGYFNYHAVPGNMQRLKVFNERGKRHWRRALRRRGQTHRPNWARILRLVVDGSQNRKYSTLTPMHGSPLVIQDKNRMR